MLPAGTGYGDTAGVGGGERGPRDGGGSPRFSGSRTVHSLPVLLGWHVGFLKL